MNATYVLVAVALLLANGFFVGAEFALIAARRSRIEQMAEEGGIRAALALKSVRELSLMLAGAQLGITMASLGLGAIAEPAVAHAIEELLTGFVTLPAGAVHAISFSVALAIVVFFHMVVGEMAPKNVAIAEPERAALWIAAPFRFYVLLFRPLIRLLNALANAGVRAVGVNPVDELSNVHTADEIALMVTESARRGMIDKFEHHLLRGAIHFADRDAASVMIPRTEVVAFASTTTAAEIERLVVETGHSRYPVFGKDLDNILGFFHAKDLLKIEPSERDRPLDKRLIRQMLVVPESRKLHPLLLDMRRNRQHFALVIDEHGGTAGIVTLEDLLEELVGEIRDEYDIAEMGIVRVDENRFLMPGNLRIDEAEQVLGIDLPEGEYETVAGFLMDRLGRIPRRRDTIKHDGWRLRVRSMQRRRVLEVAAERIGPERKDEDGRG